MSSDRAAGSVGRRGGAFAEAVLRPFLSRIEAGGLTVALPSGVRLGRRGPRPGPQAEIAIHRWRAIRRLVTHGDAGFAESYIAGDWSSADLPAFIEFAALNLSVLEASIAGTGLARFLARLRHRGRANSRVGSRKNIAFHYDLGNDFYRSWLDEGMTYSSALYREPDDSLERAQARKIERVGALLDVGPDDHVLEIGCGWGTLALALAANCKHIDAVTLSAAQHAYAERRVAKAGLGGAVSLALRDYRDIEGAYDRIVSIEMIEAIGERYWPVYFRTLRDRLRPGGRAVLQAITIDESRFEAYRRSPDFIQQRVFPGGMLPTRSAILHEAAARGLECVTVERFGASYALTLAEWRRRFSGSWRAIEGMGFSKEFRRMWDYYLSYCEGGFRAGVIDVGFYVFRRAA